jgi:hypothetical protein
MPCNQALPGLPLNYRIMPDRRGGFPSSTPRFDETGGQAIKYLPASLVCAHIVARARPRTSSFRYGMKCFFEGGRAYKDQPPERRPRVELLSRERRST